MPNFDTSRAQLGKARANQIAARFAVSRATEQERRLKKQIAQTLRVSNPNEPDANRQRNSLEAKLKQVTEERQRNQAVLDGARLDVDAALKQFGQFTDPRGNVNALSDRSPFLLFPVRLETRFVTAGDPARAQLWVRIYPDDCSIDTFEDTFSETELANAKLYWERMWRAGGIEADERAAWSALVAAHGSGRASWIVDHYQPVNISDKPAKVTASDEILVIPTLVSPPAGQTKAISDYWKALWLADGDKARDDAAFAALEAAVGAATADQVTKDYSPFNLPDKPTAPLKKSDVTLSVAFVVFPSNPDTKQDSWSQAPFVSHLADRFVVFGYFGGDLTLEAVGNVISLPLIVGPNPATTPSETIHPDNGDLFVPDELKWLVDFEEAVAVGMGIKIDLTPEQASQGFDRLLVVGLELSSTASDAKAALELLLEHHHNGRSGLSLVPQGTPTHNIAGVRSGYTELDNAEESFNDRKHAPLFSVTSDPTQKRDGQWLAELVGVDPSIFFSVHASDGTDQIVSRAMQTALWPATFGYWMDKLLIPIFTDETVDDARWFFTSFVSGCGAIPAVRIGGEPYGILPTTAFSRITWPVAPRFALSSRPRFLQKLWEILRKIDADWTVLSASAEYVGKSTADAHAQLLSIVGLHPSSVEFHTRYAESLAQIYNMMNLWSIGPDFWKAFIALADRAGAQQLLARLGYASTAEPDILKQVFFSESAQIETIIDDVPLSESNQIRAYTDDNRNYISWLIDATKTSLNAVVGEQGFSGNKTPQALLYLFLRHAITLAYYDSSYNLHKKAAFLNDTELRAMKPEPPFIHTDASATGSESRLAALYKVEPRITANPSLLVSDFITQNIGLLPDTATLGQMLASLEILAKSSTASLERAFSGHIDCCSYRYDAWLLGLASYSLQNLRNSVQGDNQSPSTGLYLGAYAWLENLRPSRTKLSAAQVPDGVRDNFKGSSPMLFDPENEGYVHAPSLAHAETAAVLRAGYLANATKDNPETLAVNLSSDRVRVALSMLEGIRNGQSLSALLGYQFERGLHDDFALVEVDKFIYPIRKAFPLVADAIADTKTAPDVAIEAIEASNVMDGLKLIAQIRKSGQTSYPFGADLPTASSKESDAITAQAKALLDIHDAIGDVALAEGVHQAVQGNFDRIASTLEAYTVGNFPPEPEVIQTPPSGIGLTHRVAVHFKSGLSAAATATPRATAEPALNNWIESLVPPLDSIQCKVIWSDPVTSSEESQTVSLQDLGILPIDVLTLLKPDDIQSMSELDDRVLTFVNSSRAPRPDAKLTIQYMASEAGKFNFFETMSLLRALKSLVGRSRPLKATDAILHNSASPSDDNSVFVDSARILKPKTSMSQLATDIAAFLSGLSALTADPVANRAALILGIDGFAADAEKLLSRCALFNTNQSGWGFLADWKHLAFFDLLAAVSSLVARWTQKLSDFDSKVTAYDALPSAATDDVRFQLLSSAELLIVPVLGTLPSTPATMRTDLTAKRGDFADRLANFQDVLDEGTTSFAKILAKAKAIPTSDLDATPFDLNPFEDRILVFAQDLVTNLTGKQSEIAKRIVDTQMQFDLASAASAQSDQVKALVNAAKALFGPDFLLFPEFSISAAQGAEWENAMSLYSSGALLNYLQTEAKIDFPVDEWLHGVARIRPNMGSWEQLVLFSSAFNVGEPLLVPAQFPFEAGASWLALEFPSDYDLSGDRLLYTAQYSAAFDKSVRQCGMLVDEWTEIIPATSRTTGVTFHYDRPNNEAPQSLLLVTSATQSGNWIWDDVLAALNETLDLAKKRAVEPAQLDATPYASLLPATVTAVTQYAISISMAMATANGLFTKLESSSNA